MQRFGPQSFCHLLGGDKPPGPITSRGKDPSREWLGWSGHRTKPWPRSLNLLRVHESLRTSGNTTICSPQKAWDGMAPILRDSHPHIARHDLCRWRGLHGDFDHPTKRAAAGSTEVPPPFAPTGIRNPFYSPVENCPSDEFT